MPHALRIAIKPLLAGLVLAVSQGVAWGQACDSCGPGCAPGPGVSCWRAHLARFFHCGEEHPIKSFCRRMHCTPVCNPCGVPHYGYFEPCWRPWPFPPDYSHCPVVVPPVFAGPVDHGPPPVLPGTMGYDERGMIVPAPQQNGAGTPPQNLPPPQPQPMPQPQPRPRITRLSHMLGR